MGMLILGILIGALFCLSWSFVIWCALRFFKCIKHTSFMIFTGFTVGYYLFVQLLTEVEIPILTTVSEGAYIIIALAAFTVNVVSEWGIKRISKGNF